MARRWRSATSRTSTQLDPNGGQMAISPSTMPRMIRSDGGSSGPRTGPSTPTGCTAPSSSPSPSSRTNRQAARSASVLDLWYGAMSASTFVQSSSVNGVERAGWP